MQSHCNNLARGHCFVTPFPHSCTLPTPPLSPSGFTTNPAGINNISANNGSVFADPATPQALYMTDTQGKTLYTGECFTYGYTNSTTGFKTNVNFTTGSSIGGLVPLQVGIS